MLPRLSRMALAAAVVLLTGGIAMSATTPHRFVQDRFAIGFWVDPPAGADMDERYREIAAANFTVVLGGFGARTPATVQQQAALCERYGLRALVATAGLPPERLPESPAIWGYMLRDEPNTADFAALRADVDALRAARPGRLAYINLFPNYATPEQLGAADYDDHVRRFMAEVDVDVLSMDHYPAMRPDADGRQGYCDNLETLRRHADAAGIPFWNFFNTMPFGPHYDPTEAQLRWQVYTSLAYGAKGVLYFCYWTPAGDEFPRGGAIITAEGRRTRHYEQAKRLNAAVRNLGPTLMGLRCHGVIRPPAAIESATGAVDTALLAGSPLRHLTAGDFLIGVFSHADGRRAVLLNNYSYAHTAWPTVEFSAPLEQVREVDPASGQEVAVVDDSPAMPGLQLSLDAGEGRLFLLPR